MSARCLLQSQCLDQMLSNVKTSIISFLYLNESMITPDLIEAAFPKHTNISTSKHRGDS